MTADRLTCLERSPALIIHPNSGQIDREAMLQSVTEEKITGAEVWRRPRFSAAFAFVGTSRLPAGDNPRAGLVVFEHVHVQYELL